MATPQFFEGDAYGDEPRRPSMLPMVLVLAGTLGAVGLGAWLLFAGSGERDPMEKAGNLLGNIPPWTGIQATPARAAIPEQDKRYEDLMKLFEAQAAEQKRQADEHAAFRKAIEELSKQRQAPAGTPKKQNAHRVMAATYFELPADKSKEEALFDLAAGDTILPCTLRTKTVSAVESNYTAMITANVWDTKSRSKVLIPQGSTLMGTYRSNDLLYGSLKLPMFSTLLTLPNGTTRELEDIPLMDEVGTAGHATRVKSPFWRALPAVLIQGVLRGSQQAIATGASTGAEQVAVGTSQGLAQYGQRVVQPYIDLRYQIEVDPGSDCVAILTKTMRFAEYKE